MLRHFHSPGSNQINRSHGLAARLIAAHIPVPQLAGSNTIPDGIGHHPGEASGGVGTYASQYGVVPTFDASDDTINMGTIADWNGKTYGTLVGAMYRASTSVTCGFGGANGNSAATVGSRFSFAWLHDGNLYFSVNNAGSATYGFLSLNTTGWQHVAAIYDGSQSTNATKLRLYLNGVAQSPSYNGTIPTSYSANPLNPFVWGRDSSNRQIGGSVHHSLLFDAILSAAEIQLCYQEWLMGFPTLLQHPQQWVGRVASAAATTSNGVIGGGVGNILVAA